MTTINVNAMTMLYILLVLLVLLQTNVSRVTGFVAEKGLSLTSTSKSQSTTASTGMPLLLLSSSSRTSQQRKRQQLSSSHHTHYHHPEHINIENGSSSNSAANKFSEVRDRLRGIFRRNNNKNGSKNKGNLLKRSNNRSSKIRYRRMLLGFASIAVSLLARPTITLAMAAMGGGGGSGVPRAPLARKDQLTTFALFFSLFGGLALLHAAEIAITTLYPWKVKEFAEEEEKLGKRGTFKILNEDITRVLTTILVASTTCSIFATTVFTHLMAAVFGTAGEKYGALALTALTLFFVELLPKSIGVTNAESVARVMIPPINVMTMFVSPIGISLSWLSKKTLSLIGLKGNDSSGITDSQLRLIVTGARDAGTIDAGEQGMIQGVLGLQNRRVREIMKPRVEIIAVPKEMSVASVLGVVRESGYSRIPVYDGEIDNIVGIVLAKNVLDFFVNGVLVDEDVIKKIRENMGSNTITINKEYSSVKEKTEDVNGRALAKTLLSEEELLSAANLVSPPQLYTTENMPKPVLRWKRRPLVLSLGGSDPIKNKVSQARTR